MAQNRGRKTSSKRKSSSSKSKKNTSNFGFENTLIDDVLLIVSVAVSILLFLSNFHIIGPLGDTLSSFMFGIFGNMAYIAPLCIFFGIYIWIANWGDVAVTIKMIAATILFFMLCVFFTLTSGIKNIGNSLGEYYRYSADGLKGGGVIGGFLGNGLYHSMDMAGTVIVMILLIAICIILLSGKSFRDNLKNSGVLFSQFAERKREEADERRKVRAQIQREQELYEEEYEQSERRRMDKKVSGIPGADVLNLKSSQKKKNERKVEENVAKEKAVNKEVASKKNETKTADSYASIPIRGLEEQPINDNPHERELGQELGARKEKTSLTEVQKSGIQPEPTAVASEPAIMAKPVATPKKEVATSQSSTAQPSEELVIAPAQPKIKKQYKFPPINLLAVGKKKTNSDSGQQLRETAMKLEEVLQSFGVSAKITEISQGPAVTRYELQPEVGVKVSKIVNLADDIKMNLAATDIRIEAPIPGKAAVGIEVPNAENSAVAFRELIEAEAFQKAESNISFAVGKDIGGNIIVTDLAKMPHLLIAGATGSGKSVCINTIVMSILYKASPEDVKLIMIDPKVVELSVYNGIPHLMIPVVTDPKKAAAALNWGVHEMEERYKKFADLNVRDLKGYNQKVANMTENNGQPIPEKLPQILIIVDELADLMMVASNEVEESICRLAQLARACGIHLVIATQRPSVDVITGLIKANMPSRIAFAVSSGVDSRTILDMVGAEKLLGKGDMLFYPQGKTKPERVQGAFVSDDEVSKVVDFIKSQDLGTAYTPEIEEKITNLSSASMTNGGFTESASDRDTYFREAGLFIIEKEKASIGMLQRVYKIGFNRAARIMDQLEEVGVVGPEEGTKPRRVLMSQEEFLSVIEGE